MAIDRERRVVGDLIVQIEAAEPAIGEVQLDLLAQLPLKANAVAVTNDKHPDHQLGVDRRPADLAVERFQLLTKPSQYPRHNRIDAAQEMEFWNAPFEVKEIEQLALIDRLPTIMIPSPPLKASTARNHDSPIITSDFFNSIDPKRPLPGAHRTPEAVPDSGCPRNVKRPGTRPPCRYKAFRNFIIAHRACALRSRRRGLGDSARSGRKSRYAALAPAATTNRPMPEPRRRPRSGHAGR